MKTACISCISTGAGIKRMELNISQRILWTVAAIAVAVVLFISLKAILMPFIVGALFAYLMDPLADKLERLRLGRGVAVTIIFLFISLLLFLTLLLLLPALFEQLSHFVQRLPQILVWIQNSIFPYIEKNTGLTLTIIPLADLQQLISNHWREASSVAGNLLKSASMSTMSMVMMLLNMLIIPVVGFYLLRDWDEIMLKIYHLLPHAIRDKTVNLAKQCDEVLSAFIRGQLLVMMALGAIYAIGLSIVGVDLALFLGALAGLASVVPYLGFIVGISVTSVAAYMQFHELMPLIWVLVVFGVGQVLETIALTPLLVGDKIGLHPVAVIFAIMAGGQIAGFVGVLIALPVAAVMMVFVRHLHIRYQSSLLYQNSDAQ